MRPDNFKSTAATAPSLVIHPLSQEDSDAVTLRSIVATMKGKLEGTAARGQARKGAAIIHVHGGWFNWGTAQAFGNFVGHIALSAGADRFTPNYRLAPEHPFPVAVMDVEACYRGLVDKGITKVALTGDSAGGNLALVLLSIASAQAAKGGIALVGAVVLSPVTYLALTSESFDRRAEADHTSPNPRQPGSSVPIWAKPIRRIHWPRLSTVI